MRGIKHLSGWRGGLYFNIKNYSFVFKKHLKSAKKSLKKLNKFDIIKTSKLKRCLFFIRARARVRARKECEMVGLLLAQQPANEQTIIFSPSFYIFIGVVIGITFTLVVFGIIKLIKNNHKDDEK